MRSDTIQDKIRIKYATEHLKYKITIVWTSEKVILKDMRSEIRRDGDQEVFTHSIYMGSGQSENLTRKDIGKTWSSISIGKQEKLR